MCGLLRIQHDADASVAMQRGDDIDASVAMQHDDDVSLFCDDISPPLMHSILMLGDTIILVLNLDDYIAVLHLFWCCTQ